MVSSWACISFSTSGVTAVEPCIRPADCWMTCWDTSNTAMTILKVLDKISTATKVLKIHLKKIHVSKLCRLLWSISI